MRILLIHLNTYSTYIHTHIACIHTYITYIHCIHTLHTYIQILFFVSQADPLVTILESEVICCIYVCMYVCMYVCQQALSICMFVNMNSPMYVCMYCILAEESEITIKAPEGQEEEEGDDEEEVIYRVHTYIHT